MACSVKGRLYKGGTKTGGEEGGVEEAGDDAVHSGWEGEDESKEKMTKLVLLMPMMLLATLLLVLTT